MQDFINIRKKPTKQVDYKNPTGYACQYDSKTDSLVTRKKEFMFVEQFTHSKK